MNLTGFILRRLLYLVPMLIGITLLTFTLSHAVPADPVAANLGDQAASDPTIVAAFRHEWGLDKPLYQQYGIYLWRVIHGNLGVSISTRQPVSTDLRQRLPATIELAVAAMLISIIIGIPLGILSAARRDSAVDQSARVISLIGVSVPVFWLALVAILIFYARLGWAPAPGRLSASMETPPFHTGFIAERLTPRIATSGALMMGVNAVPPIPPRLEMVKLAPCISAGLSLLSRASAARSAISLPIAITPF